MRVSARAHVCVYFSHIQNSSSGEFAARKRSLSFLRIIKQDKAEWKSRDSKQTKSFTLYYHCYSVDIATNECF